MGIHNVHFPIPIIKESKTIWREGGQSIKKEKK